MKRLFKKIKTHYSNLNKAQKIILLIFTTVVLYLFCYTIALDWSYYDDESPFDLSYTAEIWIPYVIFIGILALITFASDKK
ncbi:hypothetical protein [Dokdonia sp. Asnod1-B02]|uniref:hypothetical protein n=1 Tax=Dokdonia sp. Asnod1-B02 TaxID=3160573 RepID=UPI00386EE051